MAKNIEFVSHKKSKLVVDGKPKLPLADSLVEGEIAINYAKDLETLSIKNESGDVVTFSSDNYYTEQKLGSGFTRENSAKTVTDALNELGFDIDQVIDSGTSASTHAVSTKAVYDAIVADEKAISMALNDLYTITDDLDEAKQDTLVSGVNIKTLNGESLIGRGDIDIDVDAVTAITEKNSGSTSPIAVKAVTNKMGVGFDDYTITDAIVNIEEVTAAAFNDMNERKLDVSAYTPVDLDDYYTKEETSGASEISAALDDKLDASEYTPVDLSDYYRKEETSGKTEISNALEDKLDTSAFNTYSAATESVLNSKVDNSTFNGYSAATEAVLSGLETNKLDASAYTPTQEVWVSGSGVNSVVMKGTSGTASGDYSIAEGLMVTASGGASHAEGGGTIASGNASHAEGNSTIASGSVSHAEGTQTVAGGESSHAEGISTQALGDASHAEGELTIAANDFELAAGILNKSVSGSSTFGDSGNTLFSIGNGTAENARHNAFEIRQNGDIYITNKDGNDVRLQDEIGNVPIDQVIDSGTSASTNAVATKAVYDVITENEEIVAAALTSLNDRKADVSALTEIEESLADKIGQTIDTTYSALKALRDNSQLVPGQWYRITDFVTTVDLAEARSAGHAFDVIVRADAANVLNENAFAALHSGDTYFANCKLEAWELKYTIDNDKTRFDWADTTNGKGVIYWMKDEFGNEVPRDFKNIQYKLYKVADSHPTRTSLNNKYVGIKNKLPYDSGASLVNGQYVSRPQTLSIPDDTDYIWAYTFSSGSSGGIQTDMSLLKSNNVKNNIIGRFTYNALYPTNDSFWMVMYGRDNIDNHINSSASVIADGNNNSNILELSSTVFGGNVVHTSVDVFIGNSTFGKNISNCTFLGYFGDSSLGDDILRNAFAEVMELYCGNMLAQNTFGNRCYYINLGSEVRRCHFENNIRYITCDKDYLYDSRIETHNNHMLLTSNQTTASATPLQNITIKGATHTSESDVMTISHNSVGDTFETTYQNANNQIINV